VRRCFPFRRSRLLTFVIPGDGSAATRDPEQGGARERETATHAAGGRISPPLRSGAALFRVSASLRPE